MPFKYSCFISYQHSNYELVENFVNEIHRALSKELELYTDLPVYLDKARLVGGESWGLVLATPLCESVCMIPVLTPTYFSQKNTYCAREYLAMESLEKERIRLLPADRRQARMILPVILRGAARLPKEIMSRQYLDLSDYLLVDGELSRRPAYYSRISGLAHSISELYEMLRGLPEDPCRHCDEFALPGETEVIEWVRSLSITRPSFPGMSP